MTTGFIGRSGSCPREGLVMVGLHARRAAVSSVRLAAGASLLYSGTRQKCGVSPGQAGNHRAITSTSGLCRGPVMEYEDD